MRINYLAYFDPTHYGGGGEMVMRGLIETGRRRGHDITITTVRPRRFEIDERADLYWLTDVYNFPGTAKSLGAWRHFDDGLLHEIMSRGRYVHFVNAYADVCNLPWLPCSGHAAPRCPCKSRWRLARNLVLRDFGGACFATREAVRALHARAALNVYVSPLHARTVHGILGFAAAPPSFVLRPTIDTTRFYDRGLERDIDYLFVGVIGEAKGLEEMRARYAGKDIHFVGKLAPGARLDFGTHHGHVPYDDIPLLMNRARHFVFLPRWPEPMGRVVVEAALCGCTLITNDNVGATSFPFDLAQPGNHADAEGEFWDRMEGLA